MAIPLGLELGAVFRVRKDAKLMRDAFRAGEVLVFWRHAYSIYDDVHGFFFRQPGSAAVRSWDVESPDPRERDALLERIAPPAPVIAAARSGDVEAVRAALPAEQNEDGALAVELAIEGAIDARRPGAIAVLLASGPLPDARRVALLHHAATAGLAPAVAALLDAGVPADAADPYGQTALLHAACSGDLPTVDLLLARGASAAVTTDSGNTPRSLAAARRHEAIVARLDAALRR